MCKVLVETSARHMHITQEHLEILFGKGYELTKKKEEEVVAVEEPPAPSNEELLLTEIRDLLKNK